MSAEEVEILFKNVTKVQRTLGVNISITKLTEKVFRALDALLIERMKDSVAKSMKPLHELLQRYDANQDGFLEYSEVETMLLECQLAFKPQMFQRISTQIFDIAKVKKSNKVAVQTLKFFLASDSQQSSVVSSSH